MRVILIHAFLLLSSNLLGKELQQLRSVDLASETPEAEALLGTARHSTFAMAFSPDDKSLALAFGTHKTVGGPVLHVLVLDTTTYRRSFAADIPADLAAKLEWSRDGAHLLVQAFGEGSWVFSPSVSGLPCHVDRRDQLALGFVSKDTFAAAQNTRDKTTLLRFYDVRCTLVGESVTPFAINYGSADSKNNLIAAANRFEGVEIFHVFPWQKIAVVEDPELWYRSVFFGDGAGFCTGADQPSGNASVRCWSMSSGSPTQISEWPARNAQTLLAASARNAPLVAIQFTALRYNPFTEAQSGKFKEWVLWDPTRALVRGTVGAKTQARRLLPEQKRPWIVPWAAALSSSGNLFAIAGNQTLEIFATGPSVD